MQPRSLLARAFVYALLVLGSVVFMFPLIWLISTALKPIEQTSKMPPTWIPTAYYATIDGRHMEVTRDFRIDEPSAVVTPTEGPEAGKRALVPLSTLARQPASAYRVIQRVDP